MSPPESVAHVVLDGSISSLERVQSELARLWSKHPWVEEVDRMAVQTAVIELATNIVRYALADARSTADLSVTLTRDAVHATTLDRGPAFEGDLSARAMPDPTAESGRGFSVIAALTHEFAYTRDADGNHWSLVRRLTPTELRS